MTQLEADDSVSDDEWLMRRVPAGICFFDPRRPPESPMGVTWLAFKPRDDEREGISLSRMKSLARSDFLTMESFAALACAGRSIDKHFYVVLLRAGDLTDPKGLAQMIHPDATLDDPGHVLVTTLHAQLDKRSRDNFINTFAREMCHRVIGPFNRDGLIQSQQIDWRRISS